MDELNGENVYKIYVARWKVAAKRAKLPDDRINKYWSWDELHPKVQQMWNEIALDIGVHLYPKDN